jgi:hypothetical protein
MKGTDLLHIRCWCNAKLAFLVAEGSNYPCIVHKELIESQIKIRHLTKPSAMVQWPKKVYLKEVHINLF